MEGLDEKLVGGLSLGAGYVMDLGKAEVRKCLRDL